MTYDAAFFSKNPGEVAEEILGAYVSRYGGKKRITVGFLAALDVLEQPDNKDSEIYQAPPGTFIRYASKDGFRLAISCHPRNGSGIITLLKMICDDEPLMSEEIYSGLGGDLICNKAIGQRSGIYMAKNSIDLEHEGFQISRKMPSNSPLNRRAYFEIIKQ